MAMNREQRRLLQRQGELGPDGEPVQTKKRASSSQPNRKAAAPRTKDERVGPVQFAGEVRSELRKVAWPSRPEVINYSIVVFITLVIVTAMIYGLDWAFGQLVLLLFDV